MKARKSVSWLVVFCMIAVYVLMLGSSSVFAEGTVSNVLSVGPGQSYATVAAAITAAQPGDTIEVDAAGVYYGSNAYTWVSKDNITIKGVNGRPKMEADPTVKVAGYKGIWVVNANNVTIENFEFAGAHDFLDSGHNWAGIRIDGVVSGNVTIRNIYTHNNDDGILSTPGSTSNVVLENSELAYNGFLKDYGDGFIAGDGQSHNLYNGTQNASLTFRYNYSHDCTEGHLLKTRAKTGYIEYNMFTDQNADGKWAANSNIDMPDVGTYYVIGNVFQQSEGGNWRMLSYGVEGAVNSSKDLYVVNNTFVNDVDDSNSTFIQMGNSSSLTATVKNNIFTGKGYILQKVDGTDLSSSVDSSNLKNVNPGFVDMANYNYRLTAAALEAIDKGVNPGVSAEGYSLVPVKQYVQNTASEARPVCSKLDIGAYEYVIAADVNFDPDVIKLNALSGTATVYLAFPADTAITSFDLSNVKLNSILSPITDISIGYVKNVTPVMNANGMLEVMMKFNKRDIAKVAADGVIVISGSIGDSKYVGKTTIKILK